VQRTLFLSKMKIFSQLYVKENNPSNESLLSYLKEVKDNVKMIDVMKKKVTKKMKKMDPEDVKIVDFENYMNELNEVENVIREMKKSMQAKLKEKGKKTYSSLKNSDIFAPTNHDQTETNLRRRFTTEN